MKFLVARLIILVFGFSLIWGCTSTPEYPESDAAHSDEDAGPTSDAEDAAVDGSGEVDAGP
ncbi:MAG: hypothetical protein ACLFVJ_19185, partial [Persicimonas sp.]